MAATIGDVHALVISIVTEGMLDEPLDSIRIPTWKCVVLGTDDVGCGGVWKESVQKRSQFTKCPECQKGKGRKARVTRGGEQLVKVPQKRTPFPKEKVKVHVGVNACVVCFLDATCVKCPSCDFSCCKECLEKYICESPVLAMCMSCKVELPLSYLANVFGQPWLVAKKSPFYAHRIKVYTEQEKARFPETLELVKDFVRMKELNRREYSLTHKISEGNKTHSQLNKLREKRDEMRGEIAILSDRIYGTPIQAKFPSYIQGCPVSKCRGLVSSETYACVVCDAQICDKCLVMMSLDGNTEKHTCNPHDVLTIKSMEGNTKPCPKCAALVYKIDGCDQMWCVACHVAFSWTHGTIEKRTIHNPHYFEWLRMTSENGEIPRNAGRVNDECDEELEIDHDQFIREMHRHLPMTSHYWQIPMGRVFAMIEDDLEFYRTEVSAVRWLFTNRLRYLSGQITYATWELNVYKWYRDIENQTLHRELRHGLATVMEEMIEEVYNKVSDINDKINEIAREFAAIPEKRCEKIAKCTKEKDKMLCEYEERIEGIRTTFLGYYTKACSHMRSNEFHVYTTNWDLVTYSNHLKGTKFE